MKYKEKKKKENNDYYNKFVKYSQGAELFYTKNCSLPLVERNL